MLELKPFAPTSHTEQLQVSASILRLENGDAELIFELSGKLDLILWPTEFPLIAERKHALWEHTCLEAFFSTDQEKLTSYAEINCAANGHWAFYTLSSYRQDLSEYHAGSVHLLTREETPQGVRFVIAVKGLPWSASTGLFVGITAVIEFKNGDISYWAISHAEKEADFHSKKSFIARI
jgi:hypothetical protein